MPLTDQDAILIACRAMNPFVNDPLLTKNPDGTISPIAKASQYQINQVLADLQQNDSDYGLHVINFIVDSLQNYCKEKGYSLTMGPADLLDSTQIKTIGDLANWIKGETDPI